MKKVVGGIALGILLIGTKKLIDFILEEESEQHYLYSAIIIGIVYFLIVKKKSK